MSWLQQGQLWKQFATALYRTPLLDNYLIKLQAWRGSEIQPSIQWEEVYIVFYENLWVYSLICNYRWFQQSNCYATKTFIMFLPFSCWLFPGCLILVGLVAACNSDYNTRNENIKVKANNSLDSSDAIKPLGYWSNNSDSPGKPYFDTFAFQAILQNSKSLNKIALIKDSFVTYVPCVLPEGTGSVFCLGPVRDIGTGAGDPEFSWLTPKGWTWDEHLQFRGADGVHWITKCHSSFSGKDHGRQVYRIWFSSGHPNQNDHNGEMPVVINVAGNRWRIVNAHYRENEEYTKLIIRRE